MSGLAGETEIQFMRLMSSGERCVAVRCKDISLHFTVRPLSRCRSVLLDTYTPSLSHLQLWRLTISPLVIDLLPCDDTRQWVRVVEMVWGGMAGCVSGSSSSSASSPAWLRPPPTTTSGSAREVRVRSYLLHNFKGFSCELWQILDKKK